MASIAAGGDAAIVDEGGDGVGRVLAGLLEDASGSDQRADDRPARHVTGKPMRDRILHHGRRKQRRIGRSGAGMPGQIIDVGLARNLVLGAAGLKHPPDDRAIGVGHVGACGPRGVGLADLGRRIRESADHASGPCAGGNVGERDAGHHRDDELAVRGDADLWPVLRGNG
jgi:hypothetical protein